MTRTHGQSYGLELSDVDRLTSITGTPGDTLRLNSDGATLTLIGSLATITHTATTLNLTGTTTLNLSGDAINYDATDTIHTFKTEGSGRYIMSGSSFQYSNSLRPNR